MRFFPLIALAIAIALVFTYIQPTYNGAITSAQTALASDNQALAAAQAYQKQKDTLTSQVNAIAPADLARLVAYLPDSVNNVQTILDLNALASRSGIVLSNIAVNAPNTSQVGVNLSSIDLSLSGSGTYSAFRTFLGALEKSARVMDIEQIGVGGSATGVYTYMFDLRLYWLSPATS